MPFDNFRTVHFADTDAAGVVVPIARREAERSAARPRTEYVGIASASRARTPLPPALAAGVRGG